MLGGRQRTEQETQGIGLPVTASGDVARKGGARLAWPMPDHILLSRDVNEKSPLSGGLYFSPDVQNRPVAESYEK
jgi:hypothetical protein